MFETSLKLAQTKKLVASLQTTDFETSVVLEEMSVTSLDTASGTAIAVASEKHSPEHLKTAFVMSEASQTGSSAASQNVTVLENPPKVAADSTTDADIVAASVAEAMAQTPGQLEIAADVAVGSWELVPCPLDLDSLNSESAGAAG
jgi:hypothetical protein